MRENGTEYWQLFLRTQWRSKVNYEMMSKQPFQNSQIVLCCNINLLFIIKKQKLIEYDNIFKMYMQW